MRLFASSASFRSHALLAKLAARGAAGSLGAGFVAVVALAAGEEVEFHGYEVQGDEVRFSLTRREADGRVVDAWATPGRATAGFLVRGFDAETEIVQVDCDGRTIYLALAGGHVAAMPIAVALTAASTPLEIANEIGRSRARRLAAAGMAPATTATQ